VGGRAVGEPDLEAGRDPEGASQRDEERVEVGAVAVALGARPVGVPVSPAAPDLLVLHVLDDPVVDGPPERGGILGAGPFPHLLQDRVQHRVVHKDPLVRPEETRVVRAAGRAARGYRLDLVEPPHDASAQLHLDGSVGSPVDGAVPEAIAKARFGIDAALEIRRDDDVLDTLNLVGHRNRNEHIDGPLPLFQPDRDLVVELEAPLVRAGGVRCPGRRRRNRQEHDQRQKEQAKSRGIVARHSLGTPEPQEGVRRPVSARGALRPPSEQSAGAPHPIPRPRPRTSGGRAASAMRNGAHRFPVHSALAPARGERGDRTPTARGERGDPTPMARGWTGGVEAIPKRSTDPWRRRPDSNRGSGICSPVPYHLATAPRRVALPGGRPRSRTWVGNPRVLSRQLPQGASPGSAFWAHIPVGALRKGAPISGVLPGAVGRGT
jgi:hypothetical protein